MRTVPSTRFEILKRQASRLKKDSGITHSQALDRIAIENGYSNWSRLAKSVDSRVTSSKPHKIQIYCSIPRDPGNTEPFFWCEEVPCMYPGKHYADMGWMHLQGVRHRNRDGVAEILATTRRAINFMDETGLRTSRAWTSLFKGDAPYGLDHTNVWRDENKRIIITTEPYFAATGKIEKLTEWCKANDWQLVRTPRNVGIWNPCDAKCSADCSSHTNMFILAPKKNGGDVENVLSMLC